MLDSITYHIDLFNSCLNLARTQTNLRECHRDA